MRRGSKISDHQIVAFFLEVWLSEERTLSSPSKRTSRSGSSVKGLWQNFERHIAIQPGVSRAIPDKDLGTRSHDALGVVARVAFPLSIGPEDRIGRLRGGICRPKVATAVQAGPELVGRPGFPGIWICEIHECTTPLAAHLKVDISHSPDSSAKPSWCPANNAIHVLDHGFLADRVALDYLRQPLIPVAMPLPVSSSGES